MDLQPYVDNIQRQLEAAAETGGDEARALAERLVAPLDSAIRLALQDALAAAAEEITVDLAPGSVELRLRGRDLEFVVTAAAGRGARGDAGSSDAAARPWTAPTDADDVDEGGMSRINLRLPEQLKVRIERAASGESLSVNAWLVRVAAARVERNRPRTNRTSRHGAERQSLHGMGPLSHADPLI